MKFSTKEINQRAAEIGLRKVPLNESTAVGEDVEGRVRQMIAHLTNKLQKA